MKKPHIIALALLAAIAISCKPTGGEEPTPTPANTHEGHEYVDLGITDKKGNSVCFATTNIGATNPEDFGFYFAWGETAPKSEYASDFSNYFDTEDNGATFIKYDYGKGTKKLQPEDDAATVCWGGDWRIPTHTELQQIIDTCSWTWTTINGINGYTITATNGNSIFLPAAGFKYNKSIAKKNKKGLYWTCETRSVSPSTHAWRMWIMNEEEEDFPSLIGLAGDRRYYGESIRPVLTIKKQ